MINKEESTYTRLEVGEIYQQLINIYVGRSPLYLKIEQNNVRENCIRLEMHRVRGGVDVLTFKIRDERRLHPVLKNDRVPPAIFYS